MSNILPLSSPDPGEQVLASETIHITHVPSSDAFSLRTIVLQAEMQVIARTLAHTGWNRKRTAAQLRISYRSLLYKIRRHNLTPPPAGDRHPAA